MNLAFLVPSLLAGLGVLAIPALIHLISKRRARRVKFAPIDLLLRSRKRTARSIRLRQILLLLLRTLLFACAALAVAQPLLKADTGPKPTLAPLVVVVAIDTSASMHAHIDGKSMFEAARARALDEFREMPADVRVGAVACDDEPRDLATPTFERAAVIDAVTALTPRHHHGDLLACAARATSLARTVEGEGERRVVVLSDLARLGRDASPVEADPPKILALDDRRLEPELRRADRGDIAAGPGTENDKVVGVRHLELQAPLPLRKREGPKPQAWEGEGWQALRKSRRTRLPDSLEYHCSRSEGLKSLHAPKRRRAGRHGRFRRVARHRPR